LVLSAVEILEFVDIKFLQSFFRHIRFLPEDVCAALGCGSLAKGCFWWRIEMMRISFHEAPEAGKSSRQEGLGKLRCTEACF
jgi:hypothetical protein